MKQTEKLYLNKMTTKDYKVQLKIWGQILPLSIFANIFYFLILPFLIANTTIFSSIKLINDLFFYILWFLDVVYFTRGLLLIIFIKFKFTHSYTTKTKSESIEDYERNFQISFKKTIKTGLFILLLSLSFFILIAVIRGILLLF